MPAPRFRKGENDKGREFIPTEWKDHLAKTLITMALGGLGTLMVVCGTFIFNSVSGAFVFAQDNRPVSAPDLPAPSKGFSNLDKVYRDETHCLTASDMRGDQDKPISCWCRDVVMDARYVYLMYLLPGKDTNLNGAYLRLERDISETCGETFDFTVAQHADWKWNGPEVVRNYPPDDVINRIRVELNGSLKGRWVPFTVQLVYRDAVGRTIKTENYSSREFIPLLPDNLKKKVKQ
jgi:hypothetical protein